jgi:lysophospholipase L1-like esterase
MSTPGPLARAADALGRPGQVADRDEGRSAMTARTLVLLGDSILDNGPYTRPEPDTTAHLGRLLSPAWSIRRLAQDGATMRTLPPQLEQLRVRPDCAVLSIGGNDAAQHVQLLEQRGMKGDELLDRLLEVADDFGRRYEAAARAVVERADRTLLCTIYEVQLLPPRLARLARAPLAMLNDRILRTAARLGADALELRSVCTEPADFVMQIEPSGQGAAKIARAIAAVLRGEPWLGMGRVFSA